ncbi:MAG: hypothetical protein ACLFS3_01000 [Candidatus Aenigmatarchaeota archaeon]
MKIVVKIGGSLCMTGSGPDSDYLSSLLPKLEEIDEEHELSICVGGGELVREYGESIENFNLSDREKETCFVDIMKANVRFLSYLLDKEPKFDLSDYKGEEVIVSGTGPGRSTDANAAEVAAKMKADLLVKMTDVEGIYDRDPKEFEDAEKMDTVKFEDLEDIDNNKIPMDYGILDPLAVYIIKENRIRTAIINGRKGENLQKVIDGERIGTWIE